MANDCWNCKGQLNCLVILVNGLHPGKLNASKTKWFLSWQKKILSGKLKAGKLKARLLKKELASW